MTTVLEKYTDSITVNTDAARFTGLWLHFPEDPAGTSSNFIYGRDLRSYSIDVGGKQIVLAGREFMITEFGEHRADEFEVQVIIPHGPNYDTERQLIRSFAASKRTVVARDNRGTVVFGSISNLSEDHQSEGSSFGFQVNRVHREEIRVD